jgi:hypothetical protein
MEEQNCVIKNLVTGEQQTISENHLLQFFKR